MKKAFDDLESLKKTDFFKDSGLSMTRDAEGNYVLAQKVGSDDMAMPNRQAGPAGGGPAMDEKMMQGMAAMLAGLPRQSSPARLPSAWASA